jgi:phosphate starvation-inducible protein PhoH and related proteins
MVGMSQTTPELPDQTEHKVVVPASVPMVALLGARDEFLRVIEQSFPGTSIHARGNEVTLTGEPTEVALVERLIDELVVVIRTGQPLSADAIERSVAMLRSSGSVEAPADVLTFNILSNRGRTIRPKTLNQKKYVDAIDQHTIVFGIGPAGTGKTYLAVAKGVQALQSKQVNRIILTRPAVEAGERLGFLPGTLYEKIDPYLRPLYDALHDMMDPDSIPRLLAAGTIEVAPLAYMRGRAQPVTTPVLTPDGFRPIGGLEVGDYVVGSDGRPTIVLGVYPQGRKEVFRVWTHDGASTLACGEHLWFVTTGGDRRHGRDGHVIQTSDMVRRLREPSLRRYELPVVRPVQMPAREVPADPYTLGLLLADRWSPGASATSTAQDPELDHAMATALASVVAPGSAGDAAARRAGPAGPRARGTESVPDDYLVNSAEVRLAVLQGLLDSGGAPAVQRDRTCRVEFCTVSARLRDDVVHLARSLGGVALVRSEQGHTYDVEIRLPEGVAPFRLSRKRAVYEALPSGRPVRVVDRVEAAGEAECVCIAVAAADSLYVTEDFLVTHNTLNDAFIILDEAQNTTPEQMKMFLTRLGFGSRMVVTGDVTQTDLPVGAHSGLIQATDILTGIRDVGVMRLTSKDVVRHRLVGEIVDAYGRHDDERAAQQAARNQPPRKGRRPGERR